MELIFGTLTGADGSKPGLCLVIARIIAIMEQPKGDQLCQQDLFHCIPYKI